MSSHMSERRRNKHSTKILDGDLRRFPHNFYVWILDCYLYFIDTFIKLKPQIKLYVPNCFLIPFPILLLHRLLMRVGSIARLHSRQPLIVLLIPPIAPPGKPGTGEGVLSWGNCAWLGWAVVPCVTPFGK